MTEHYQTSFEFPRVKRRRVAAEFSGGDITSDGGSVLLREIDRRIGLSRAVTRVISDQRRQASCDTLATLVRQRLYALALGYEDLNDHQQLRHDPAPQTAAEQLDIGVSLSIHP